VRVGIVCEGIHDFPMLSSLISELASEAGITDIECDPLQPTPDASSKKSGDGGWPKVVSWCQANSGRALDTYLRAPLFDGEAVYDFIVVHLDGDIAQVCAERFGEPIGIDPQVDERVQALTNLISTWLAPPAEHLQKIKPAVPTQKTESWILAGLSANTHDWESVESKSILLDETGFLDGRPGKADHYRYLAGQLKGRAGTIRARCRSFELFAAQVF
jgi:hypothetical protein